MLTATSPQATRTGWHLSVTGLVQGVGFRPFVHRLAVRHGLDGWVRNTSGSVDIEVSGPLDALERFRRDLEHDAPPLARVERVSISASEPSLTAGFVIAESVGSDAISQPVSPDVATCAACEAELFDPSNPRFRYPFITCTDCGPRFTVIDAMPYDRVRTSMAAFPQCPRCLAEYSEPGDRRHHSETNSCPACGPRIWFATNGQATVEGVEGALSAARELLMTGGILALRGLGGFHLAVDATSERAVDRLRRRKHRDAKPLAVMVRTLDEARQLAEISDAEAAQLVSAQRPIVLLRPRPGCGLASGIAPLLDSVGVMLAGTPLHHLLMIDCGRPLVMTSGNLSEEPIAVGNPEATRRLGAIADGYLLHDREIVARYDDSVVRIVDASPVLLRRARGFAPMPLALPVGTPRPLLAVGPHLKNTFTLAAGDRAYVSPHIGDLESLEALQHFEQTLDAYQRLFGIRPEVAVRDLHSGYLSTSIAEGMGLPTVIAVQHHHAHVAAVMAEHGITEPVLGVAMDGTGAGDDGTVWGAEFLLADLLGYERLGHFRGAPMPGGDLASRTPWRAALGYLSLYPRFGDLFNPAFVGVDATELALASRQIERGLNAPLASSLGRLFDAVSAILGLRRSSSYEGQAAMELEAMAGRRPAGELHCPITEEQGRLVIDPVPMLAELAMRRRRGACSEELAADFHASVARAIEVMVRALAPVHQVDTVVLSGGCFQNARLLTSVRRRMREAGLRVLTPVALPPNDGAVSFGQAAVAAARLAAGMA